MATQPTPGGDFGTWGDGLNTYLDVSLNEDGTIKPTALDIILFNSGAIVVHEDNVVTI